MFESAFLYNLFITWQIELLLYMLLQMSPSILNGIKIYFNNNVKGFSILLTDILDGSCTIYTFFLSYIIT